MRKHLTISEFIKLPSEEKMAEQLTRIVFGVIEDGVKQKIKTIFDP